MANTRDELNDIRQRCITGFNAYCKQEMENAIRAQKMKVQADRQLSQSISDAEQEKIATEKWKHVMDESAKLSETSMLAYESFTSMLCKIGALCVDLNIAIYNEQPVYTALCLLREVGSRSFDVGGKAFNVDDNTIKAIKAEVSSWFATSTEPTNRENLTIQDKIQQQCCDIIVNRVQLPEITYSITYDADKNDSLKIDLYVPDSITMDEAQKEEIKGILSNTFFREVLRNDFRLDNGKIQQRNGLGWKNIVQDDFNLLRYNAANDRFADHLNANQIPCLTLRTIDSAPRPALVP